MKSVLLGMLCLTIAGCSKPPTIKGVSDSAVQVLGWGQSPVELFDAEAARGCAIYGKTAVPVSSQCHGLPCFTKTRNYACQ
jgi:hypothetical protein